ncbi:MAG: glycerol-3-phosphate dehydrogenase/oxidase [Nevskia sp.]|nr:glycerol-3-phosphate dehydrogenase/oxidase [Nevskia sp.]
MIGARFALADLAARYDIAVIGGGITGAGILHEAARTGVSALLVEQNDFASGTSCSSSKLVHGGLRYLKDGQWRLTLESVRERNHLLRTRAGLVERQPFLMPVYRGMKPGRAVMRLGLAAYDVMGGRWRSRSLSARHALQLEPGLRSEGLLGALAYDDARTDDARLVLRLIMEATAAGAHALNYMRVASVMRSASGVCGVALRDSVTGATREIGAGIVINAAGAWSDRLPGDPGGAPPLRPLRGSHLIFPLSRLPVNQAVSWLHVRDGRPVFVYPWDGVALYGTTDVDHLDGDPGKSRMTPEEAEYLMEGLVHQFPQFGLTLGDATACYSGVRPVVAGGKADPSAESRESAIWSSPGWVGITGGKLTTFRVTARKVLSLAAQQQPRLAPLPGESVAPPAASRMEARYGADGARWLAQSLWARDRERIAGSPYTWGELRWAARRESVMRLDDLLLRRTRLGLLLPEGGAWMFDGIAAICRDELGWSEARWVQERNRYLELWRRQHAVKP